MKKLTFLGAAGMVTGSNYLLTKEGGESLIVDMGMFQGHKEITSLNSKPLSFDPKTITGVILTHAHLDHTGRLPLLVKNGFSGEIYATSATKVLTELVLMDSAKIAKEDPDLPVLYDEQDVQNLLMHIKTVDYHKNFSVAGLDVIFRDAGHILGSASCEVIDEGDKDSEKIVFSGDLGNTPENIVRPTETFDNAQVVVMESTYGGKIHPHDNPVEILGKEINEVERSGSVLLIPSFSLERAQVLLHMLDHLKTNQKIRSDTQVFLDSPMAVKATNIYKQFKSLYNEELSVHASDNDPFDFPGLHLVESYHESKRISETSGVKVIIAGSGMMTGGRILEHAVRYLPDANNRLLIVGYMGEGTVGRQIKEGEKKVLIKGTEVEVNAHISEISSLSAHADEPRLLDWLKAISSVRKVFLTHGEDEARQKLKQKIKNELNFDYVILPILDQTATI